MVRTSVSGPDGTSAALSEQFFHALEFCVGGVDHLRDQRGGLRTKLQEVVDGLVGHPPDQGLDVRLPLGLSLDLLLKLLEEVLERDGDAVVVVLP